MKRFGVVETRQERAKLRAEARAAESSWYIKPGSRIPVPNDVGRLRRQARKAKKEGRDSTS